jgi:Fe-S-cluster containining protein
MFDSTFNVELSKTCEPCYHCCSAEMTFPKLFPLEKDFVENHIKSSSKEFEDFLYSRNVPLCPFYVSGKGCRIYFYRPLFCRRFGTVDVGSPIPDNCIYKGEKRISGDEFRSFIEIYNNFHLEYTEYKLSLASDDKERLSYLIEYGEELFLLDRYDEAFEAFGEALEFEPENPIAIYNIGLIFVWKKEFQVAIDYFKKLLLSENDKINPSLYCDLACSYLSIDNFTEAEVYFNKAINLNPANPLAHTGLFLVFKETGQKFKARRKLKQMEMYFPHDRQIKDLVEKFSE